MREALAARSGRDFVTAAPARRHGRARPGLVRRSLGAALAHPRALFGFGLLAAVGGAITLNAVLWQERVHPAPLFGTTERPAPARLAGSAPPVAPPLPPARPSPSLAASPQTQPAASATTAGPAPLPARPTAARDSIADLIRGGETGAVPRAEPRPETGRAAAAQRALVSLGYGPLAADGVVGRETRTAIERFERDRRLPVTGEFNPRTLKELATRSGLPLD